VRKIDRAIAYKLLHHLYQREGKIEEALAAWREAGRLDSSLRVELLPDVCRMLIVAHQFSEAQKAIALDRVQVRKLFFQGLAAYEDGKPDEATVTWRKLLNLYGPPAQNEGLDEFAETCLRMTSTTSAVMALEALVGRGQTTCWRSTILGLAYAQRGLFDRAVKQLEIALRLGDLDRPRRTLPASGERRVLDANALALYNAIQVDPAIRQRIDAYFSPGY